MKDIDDKTILNVNGNGIFLNDFYKNLEESLSDIGITDEEVSPECAKRIAIAFFYALKNKF